MQNVEHRSIRFLQSKKWGFRLIYWIFAALALFFIISNRNYDVNIRVALVSILIVFGFFLTQFINYVLVPRFLWQNRLVLFAYLTLGSFIITLWLNMFASFLILFYSAFWLTEIIVPTRSDIIILIAGNYLVVIFAVVIHFIRESYNRLIEKKEIEKQQLITEGKLNEIHLKLLQSQLHPHFLFNMLNNLFGLVKQKPDVAREVIIKLSDLLEYMLYKCDSNEIPLSNEVVFIENYIALEQIRISEKFNVKFTHPKYFDELKIAPLVLFPFVENAFKHGKLKNGGVEISMNLQINQNMLSFEVTNRFSTPNDDVYLNNEHSGIGLKNTRERLKILYGENHTMITEKDAQYFHIKLKIPLT